MISVPFEAVTFTYLKERVARYAQIRVWGSVGFVVTAILLGALIERNSDRRDIDGGAVTDHGVDQRDGG